MTEKDKDIFDRIMGLPGLRVLKPWYKAHKEVLLYLFFGGITTLVSIGSYGVCLYTCHIPALVANVISWILAVLTAYITNRIWVFESEAKGSAGIIKEMTAFFGGRLFSLLIEELIILIFINGLKCNAMAVKICAQIVVLILNYVISKFWVFRQRKR